MGASVSVFAVNSPSSTSSDKNKQLSLKINQILNMCIYTLEQEINRSNVPALEKNAMDKYEEIKGKIKAEAEIKNFNYKSLQ